jgi:EAL domain-containing protein (putative c-di-GMP-specific phosphodiesterase class I)
LLRDAAVALYEAKRRGKDSAEVFRATMRDDRNELVTLESDLRRAVERGEIEVHYQPIARLEDMDLAGFEALVRWRHRTLGLLGPERFVKVAEQTGLIKDLGRHVLIEAGRQLGIWQRTFRPKQPLFVSVNVSSTQLVGSTLVEDVQSILAREAIIRDTFKIEVTESIVMENPELAAQILERLKQLGVGLSCDDFGTGYSSLSNLRRLPFDTLKIDRAFLEAEMVDERAYIILRSIVSLAHELGLALVAEGIEAQDHIDRLSALGCEYGQGFFIGQPMTGKQVIDALSGVPYSGSKKSAMALLWERMVGARKAAERVEELPRPLHLPGGVRP